jgi:cell division protein FtsB
VLCMNFHRLVSPRSASRLWSSAIPVGLGVLCFYFAFYLFFGPNGFVAMRRVDAQLASSRAELDILTEKHTKIAADIGLMRPDGLDPDMADEQVRRTLGYVQPDEIVIHFN